MSDALVPEVVDERAERKKRARAKASALVELRINVLAYRKAGASYQAIADACHISKTRAYQIVTEELDRLNRTLGHSVEQLRALEVERLDALLVKLERQLKGTLVTRTTRSVDDAGKPVEKRDTYMKGASVGYYFAYVKVSDRRAKLLGLDKPTRVAFEPSHDGDREMPDEQLDREIASLQSSIAARTPLQLVKKGA